MSKAHKKRPPGPPPWQIGLLRFTFKWGGKIAPRYTGRRALKLMSRPQRHQRPSREEAFIQGARQISFDHDGTALKAWRWAAAPAAGAEAGTVLLVHGWAGRGSQMGAFAAPLTAAGYTVIAIDGHAHGDSPGTETNVALHADSLLAAQAAFGPFAAVIGHSFGAAASAIALGRGLQADKAILIAGAASLERVLRRFAAFARLPMAAFKHMVSEVEQRIGCHLADIDLDTLGPKIQQPVRIYHDPLDNEVPVFEGLMMERLLKNAQFIPLADAGHRRILRDERVIEGAVAFLQRDRAPAAKAAARPSATTG